MQKELTVISLFDGMSCGRIALERAGFKVGKYFASEIDKHAIKVTQHNYPDTIQIGDVTKVSYKDGVLHTENGSYEIGEVDLVIGGSPCQGFSFAGKQLNFDDPRSALFFEFVRIKEECNPKYFMLENVKMKKEYQDVITHFMGVEPITINSSLVSAQNRVRLYWTNIPGVTQPEDKGILLKDILVNSGDSPKGARMVGRRLNDEGKREDYNKNIPIQQYIETREDDKSNCVTTVSKDSMIASLELSEKAIAYMNRQVKGGRSHWDFNHHSDVREPKSVAMVANLFKGVPYNVLKDWNMIRAYHPIEVERLQTVPDNYTSSASKTQRLRMLGNGWTVDVIAWIFSFMNNLKLAV